MPAVPSPPLQNEREYDMWKQDDVFFAKPIHAMMLSNTDEAVDLVIRLVTQRPTLLCQKHDGVVFTGARRYLRHVRYVRYIRYFRYVRSTTASSGKSRRCTPSHARHMSRRYKLRRASRIVTGEAVLHVVTPVTYVTPLHKSYICYTSVSPPLHPLHVDRREHPAHRDRLQA